MVWNNGQSRLDLSPYQENAAFLIRQAMDSCAGNGFSHVSLLTLFYPIFAVRENGVVLQKTNPNVSRDFLRLKRLVNNFMKKEVSMDAAARAIESNIQRTRDQFNPYERDYWSPDAALFVENAVLCKSLNQYTAALIDRMSKAGESGIDMLNGVLDLKKLVGALTSAGSALVIFDAGGVLVPSSLSHGVRVILTGALRLAERQGKDSVALLHLLYAILDYKDGYATNVLDRLLTHNVNAARSLVALKALIWSDFAGTQIQLKPERASFSAQVADILENSAEIAYGKNERSLDEHQLFLSIISSNDATTKMLLSNQLKWPISDLITVVEKTRWNPLSALMPVTLCDCRNLSLEKVSGTLIERDEITQKIAQILFSPENHNAAIYGEDGIGKTSAAAHLALTLRKSRVASMNETPVIHLNFASVKDVADAKAKHAVWAEIFNFCEEHPRPIYVIDGLKSDFEGFLPACVNRLAANKNKLLFILDYAMKKLFEEYKGAYVNLQYVEIEEVNIKTPEKRELLEKVVTSGQRAIREKYRVNFEDGAALHALNLSADYLINKRFPQKAISLLEKTASILRTDNDLLGGDQPVVTKEGLTKTVSDEIGIPIEYIQDGKENEPLPTLLSKRVIGQDVAISKISDHLGLIKQGLIDRYRPSGVFFFAGLSGTGKTELAKQIARLYSATREIITYEMNSLREAHAISQLIGVPAGTPGYGEGGKLVNDLNKDPYSVILFDEVEKAHPRVLNPLMRLFDEGVITDTRGAAAFGNKAFFILTTNVAQFDIVNMLRENAPLEKIEEFVKNALGDYLHETTNEQMFRPEFVGRVMRSGGIALFNALSYEALEGIARRKARECEKRYELENNCKLLIDDKVIYYIAMKQFTENEDLIRRKGRYMGARPLDPLFNALVLNKLAKITEAQSKAKTIQIVMDGDNSALVPVVGDKNVNELLRQNRIAAVERVTDKLSALSFLSAQALSTLSDEQIMRLDTVLAEAAIISNK